MGRYKKYYQLGIVAAIPRTTLYRIKKLQQSRLKPYKETLKAAQLDFVTESNIYHPSESQFPGNDDSNYSSYQYKMKDDANFQGGYKLYENAKITDIESRLLILSCAIRHGLTDAAIQGILHVINFHLPVGISVDTSVYTLQKSIGLNYANVTKNWVCPNCSILIESVRNDIICSGCHTDLSLKDNYFLTFNIKAVMEALLENQEIGQCLLDTFEKRKLTTNYYSDIIHGRQYKSLNLGEYDLTCVMNADGVNPFKSSKFSFWPYLISLNELSYKKRRQHTILAALWFGENKPDFSLFLGQIAKQFTQLSRDGISFKVNGATYHSKVLFPMLACDSVARNQMQELNSHTGSYSCSWCLSRGGLVICIDKKTKDWVSYDRSSHKGMIKEGVGRKWIFRSGERAECRTEENYRQHMFELGDAWQQSIQAGVKCPSHIFGVKGASTLTAIPKFNIVSGLVYDYMHSGLLGVLRYMTLAWLNESNHNESFSVRKHINIINDRIKKWRYPSEFGRYLRGVNEIKQWKANEWRMWLMICTSVLSGLLPDVYIRHIWKFVNALSLLLQSKITSNDIDLAERLIDEFTRGVEGLYGIQYCTFNLHLLKHAPECVRNYGPLFCYSLFQFEGYNGVLVRSFSGTRKIGMQISKRIGRAQTVYSLGKLCFTNTMAHSMFDCFISKRHFYEKSISSGNVTFLGASKPHKFRTDEFRLLKSMGIEEVHCGRAYMSCIINGTYFSSASRITLQRSNCIMKAGNSLFVATCFIHVKNINHGLILCNKLNLVRTSNSNRMRVTKIQDTLRILSSNDVENAKYLCEMGVRDEITGVMQLLNEVEVE